MDDFWSAWQDLSKDPESAAIRTTVVQKGITAADSFNHLNGQLELLKKDIGYNLQNKVSDVNSLAARIADINLQIIRSESDGRMANDFRDRRDMLVEELAKIVNIDITEDNRGGMNIFVGGQALVYTTTYNTIQSVPRPDGMFDVKWANESAFLAKNGEMKALIDARDTVVKSYTDMLDTAAKAFAEMTNSVHQSGFGLGGDTDTGIPFFTIKGHDVGSPSIGTGNANWGSVPTVITTQGNSTELNGVTIAFATGAGPLTNTWDAGTKTLTVTDDWVNSNYSEKELQDLINQQLMAEGFSEKIFLNMRGATSADIAAASILLDGGINPTAAFSAGNITVNQVLINDVSKIAAAKSPITDPDNGIGDNTTALKLAQIKYDKSAINGFTVDD
jgi:flagellar hook-associated protein FlgK